MIYCIVKLFYGQQQSANRFGRNIARFRSSAKIFLPGNRRRSLSRKTGADTGGSRIGFAPPLRSLQPRTLAAPNDDSTGIGLEYDKYDALCKHLIVVNVLNGKTVGTYRLNSIESAKNAQGFYACNEFSLEDLPIEILSRSIEVGRACVAREHRNPKVLFLLWKVLLRHLKCSGKRYFFGCCSLFTQDCEIGAKVYQQFERNGYIHLEIRIQPRWEREFPVNETYPAAEQIELPALFNMYLKIGVKICGEPAIDREFGTIDYFVLFDLQAMSEKYQKMFFGVKSAAVEAIRALAYR